MTTHAPKVAERMNVLSAQSLFSLEGKTVVVTGASSGMGESLTIAMAKAGAKVIVVARRDERLKQLAAECSTIIPIACDLAIEAQRQELIAKVKNIGRVDVLINTAGMVGEVVAAEKEAPDQMAQVMELNLIAPFRLAQAFEPGMREAGGGSIINIASISGIVGIGRIPQASYVASKTGLVGLTRELAAQWGRWGVRVNAIAAGYFRSEMTEPMYASQKMVDWVTSRQPLPITGMPDDFAGTVLLLASNAGRFITGQTFAVDGGWSAI